VQARTWGVLWVATALVKVILVVAFITAARAPSAITRTALDAEQPGRGAAAHVASVPPTALSDLPAPRARETTVEYPLELSP